MWVRTIALCLLALALTPFASAQSTDRSRIAVAQALYASTATSAAEARAADERILELRREVERQRARGAGAEAELAAAQERFVAALAERDRAYAQQIAIFRGAVEDIVATPEGRAALEQFNAGEQRLALDALDRLQAERDRLRNERANLESAAGQRRIAALANSARGQGVTTAEVIGRYERIVALDPNVSNDWVVLARLYNDMNRADDALRASRNAVEKATTDPLRITALRELAANLRRRNDPTAFESYAELLRLERANYEADRQNVPNTLYLAQTLAEIADVYAGAGRIDIAEIHLIGAEAAIIRVRDDVAYQDWIGNIRSFVAVQHAGIYRYNQDYARQAQQGAAAMALIDAELLRRPESAFLLAQRASAAMYRGFGERGLGLHADAARSFAIGVEYQRERAAADPTRARAQHELFQRLNHLARSQIAANDRSGASATLEEAIAILDRTPFEQSDVAGLEASASLLATSAGFRANSSAGAEHMRQSLLISADLLARYPTGPRYFTNLNVYATTAANNSALRAVLTETSSTLSQRVTENGADWRYPLAAITSARCSGVRIASDWLSAASVCPDAVTQARALSSDASGVGGMILAAALTAYGRYLNERPERDPVAARATWIEAIDNSPNSDAYRQLARLSYTENNFADAQRYMRSYLQRTPSDFSARSDLCWYGIRERSNVAAALRECDASLNGQPNNALTLANRGIGRLLAQDYSGAESDFSAALTHGPGASRFYGRYLARMGLGREQEARADLAEAERLDPSIRATFESYGLSAPQ